MWSAQIISIEKDDSLPAVVFGVEFARGKEVFTEAIKTSEPETIVTTIRNKVKQLNKVSDYLANPIALGPVDLAEEIEVEAKTPILDLVRMKQAVELGLKTDADYQALLQTVRADVVIENIPVTTL